MAPLRFTIEAASPTCEARVGLAVTAHGAFETPAFMPVGTLGSVKGLLPHLVAQSGSQILLANTFHLALRPGAETVEALGGLHAFMQWPGPILTDSGGYQVFSLADRATIDDEGAVFRSPIDGARIALTPERAMEIQRRLGSDIAMALDDCPPSVDPRRATVDALGAPRGAAASDAAALAARAREANERSARWLERCVRAWRSGGACERQALFGIVQGGTDLEERARSVQWTCAHDLPGYAVGGVAVGEGPEQIRRVVTFTAPRLPADRPRYLMGVGYERDIVMAVRAGCDMFDCVLPTRNGRSASAFTRSGQIRLRNARFARDPRPLDPACRCLACDPLAHGWAGAPTVAEGADLAAPPTRPCFSRAYIRHLFLAGEMLGPILVSLHNLAHFQRLMADVRRAIRREAQGEGEGPWRELERSWPVLTQTPDEAQRPAQDAAPQGS